MVFLPIADSILTLTAGLALVVITITISAGTMVEGLEEIGVGTIIMEAVDSIDANRKPMY